MAAMTSMTIMMVPPARPSEPVGQVHGIRLRPEQEDEYDVEPGNLEAVPDGQNGRQDAKVKIELGEGNGHVGLYAEVVDGDEAKRNRDERERNHLLIGQQASERSLATLEMIVDKAEETRDSVAARMSRRRASGVPTRNMDAVIMSRMTMPPIVGVPCLTR